MSACKAHEYWKTRNQSSNDAPYDAPKPVWLADYVISSASSPGRCHPQAMHCRAQHTLEAKIRIECLLVHGKNWPLGAADERGVRGQATKAEQLWADHLDELRQGAKILRFKAA